MRNEPKGIIVNGKVTNHDELERYWRDRNFQLDRIQRGTFRDLREAEKEVKPLFASEPEWTKKQWNYIIQLRAMVNHLNNQVTELRARRKLRGTY